MTRKEFAVLAATIRSCYSHTELLKTEDAVDIWFSMLKDLPYKQVAYNLQKFIQTERRVPTVSDLREPLSESEHELGEAEAWSMVYRAICRSGYGAEDEYKKLPRAVQIAVGSPANLRSMATDSEFNVGVESSNFKRAYRNVLERQKAESKISASLRAEIKKIVEANDSKMIGEVING